MHECLTRRLWQAQDNRLRCLTAAQARIAAHRSARQGKACTEGPCGNPVRARRSRSRVRKKLKLDTRHLGCSGRPPPNPYTTIRAAGPEMRKPCVAALQ